MTKDEGKAPNGATLQAASTTTSSATVTSISNNETGTSENGGTTSEDHLNTLQSYFAKHLSSSYDNLPQVMDSRTAKVLERDLFVVVVACIALSIIGYVETHAMDAEARISVKWLGWFGQYHVPASPNGIIDTGFILTYPLYEFLRDNRDWNDWLAAANSIVLVIPSVYAVYVTVWKGDYSCSFRILAVQLLRALCGWYTYLPPDPTYLNSYYDFPDFVQCIFQDCHADAAAATPEVLPFVSFFSGHVATMVVVGNHMALGSSTKGWAIVLHILNVLQIVRLLATRGHYSIDMIIGWYVAVYVSAPAGRLGRYFSRGTSPALPKTAHEAFEYATGVAGTRREQRMSILMQRPEVQEALRQMEAEADVDVQSETTARIIQETASKMMQEHARLLHDELQYLQQHAKEAVRAIRERRIQESQLVSNGVTEKKLQ